MSREMAVGDFVRLYGKATVVAQAKRVKGEAFVVLVDGRGTKHFWSWSEMTDGKWPSVLEAADPGKERGALNRQLEKYRRRHGKAL